MSSGSRKRKVELNLGQKFSVLTEIHKGRTQSEIAVEFGIDRCSVSRIKRDEQKILAAIENNENTSKKRDRRSFGHAGEASSLLFRRRDFPGKAGLFGKFSRDEAEEEASEDIGLLFCVTDNMC